MPKLGMGPIRRQQLIDAAIASIHEYGLADATVARIAAKAGVSPGIVHHYFTGKDDLLFATLRTMLAKLREETVRRLAAAGAPRDRLDAVIEANFSDSQFAPDVMTAWLALYGSARQSPQLARILGLYHARLHSNLVHALRRLTGEADAHAMAEGIAAMIDGVWLRAALTGTPGDPRRARELIRRCVDGQLVRRD